MLAMAVMTVITVLLVCAMISRTTALEQRLGAYDVKLASLNLEIDEANAKTKQLEEQKTYMQTIQYIEEVAKEVLGLVEPDEILVMPQE